MSLSRRQTRNDTCVGVLCRCWAQSSSLRLTYESSKHHVDINVKFQYHSTHQLINESTNRQRKLYPLPKLGGKVRSFSGDLSDVKHEFATKDGNIHVVVVFFQHWWQRWIVDQKCIEAYEYISKGFERMFVHDLIEHVTWKDRNLNVHHRFHLASYITHNVSRYILHNRLMNMLLYEQKDE